MAIKKKKATTTRKAAAPKAKPKKRVAAAGPPAKKTFGGKAYSHQGCSTTKAGATKMAEAERAKGKLARVVKVATGKVCVYARAKR